MDPAFAIDYTRGLQTLEGETFEEVIRIIRSDMPHAWSERYRRMCEGPTNVLAVTASGFEYLFDFCSELIDAGELPEDGREDRLVVAYGLSRAPDHKRNASRIRGFPGSDDRGDRGHFAAHAAGGGLDINVFHQDAKLNRGWSVEGKQYREMERYCADHEGTFFFSRPIYADRTARPSHLEFGILLPGPSFWVELFANSSKSY
jgi:hypothetical protein